MKSFWYSLLVFILFMCSCKTKKVDSNVKMSNDIHSELSYSNRYVRSDTTRNLYIDRFNNNIIIKETIIEREYDKDTGTLTKETETEREIRQDTDKVVAEEEIEGVNIHSQDSLNHIADVSKKIESETKEEAIGGQESFGKWFGIVVGIILFIIFAVAYLKMRVK